jgi:hypothetical protein
MKVSPEVPGIMPTAYYRVVVQMHRDEPPTTCAICERIFVPGPMHYVLNAEGQAIVCDDCGHECEDASTWGGEP